jgi:4-amino-4-deoxy-L-arabinose transferase-like glycosyltransferase
MKITSYKTAACIFSLAFVLRLLVLLLTFHGNNNVTYFDDGKIALNLVAGRGYSIDYNYRNHLFYEVFLKHGQLKEPVTVGVKPTASKQPLYPLVLALFFICFGPKNFLAVFLFHAVIASVTSVILFLTFQKISDLAGILIGLGTAVYPSFVFHSVTTPESTTLLLFLIALYLMSIFRVHAAQSNWWWINLGLIGGLMVLTEPVTLPFVLLSLCCVTFVLYSRKQNVAGFAAALVIFLLVQVPWLARNYFVFHRFPVTKSVVGVVFNWGLDQSGRGTWISDDRLITLEYEGRYKSELEEDEAIRRELIRLFPFHLTEYLTADMPRNFAHFWWEVERYWDDRSIGYLAGRLLPYVLLLITALPAILRLLWRLATDGIEALDQLLLQTCALLLIVTYTAVYSVFGAYMSRYRFPVELALFVFSVELLALVLTSVVPRFFSDATSADVSATTIST